MEKRIRSSFYGARGTSRMSDNIDQRTLQEFLSREEFARRERSARLAKQRATIQAEFEYEDFVRKSRGNRLIYEAQEEAANEIVAAYQRGAVWVTLVAQPGTGKTGTALAVMRQMAQHAADDIAVAVADMFLCTGMSDIDWETQFSKNVLPTFRENICHRGNLKKQVPKLAAMKNGLIITDESHVAAGKEMTVSQTLGDAGLQSIPALEERNMRGLDISATPEGVVKDLQKWGDKAAIVILKPSRSYKGFRTMLNENRIRDAPSFKTYEELLAFFTMLNTRYAATSKKYFAMRIGETKGQDVQCRAWIVRACNALGWAVWNHNSMDRKTDIDLKMKNAPEKHTVIQVKGFWRASKRLERAHVGMTYEQIPSKRDTTVTSQGLAARLCDNYEYSGDQLNPELRPLIYCDKGAIEEYLNWFETAGCDYARSNYNAARIQSRDGRVISKPTKAHHSIINGLEDVSSDEDEPGVMLLSNAFDTREDAHRWALDTLDWNKPWYQNNPEEVKQPVVTNVGLYDLNGNPGITHVRHRMQLTPIQPRDTFLRVFNRGFGSGVRCAPVQDGENIRYIILYKELWLRIPNAGAGRAQ